MQHIIEMMNESAFEILAFQIFRGIHIKRFNSFFAYDINEFKDCFVIVRGEEREGNPVYSNIALISLQCVLFHHSATQLLLHTYFFAGMMNIISEKSHKNRLNRLKHVNLHKSN